MIKGNKPDNFNGVALIVSGFLLVSMSLAGWWVGSLIDSHYHLSPWGKIIGLIVGLITGFADLYRIALKLLKGQGK
jgi:F0F1-type ATP synthase assembly protein I